MGYPVPLTIVMPANPVQGNAAQLTKAATRKNAFQMPPEQIARRIPTRILVQFANDRQTDEEQHQTGGNRFPVGDEGRYGRENRCGVSLRERADHTEAQETNHRNEPTEERTSNFHLTTFHLHASDIANDAPGVNQSGLFCQDLSGGDI